METVRQAYPPRSLIFGFRYQPRFSSKIDYVHRRIIFNEGQAICSMQIYHVGKILAFSALRAARKYMLGGMTAQECCHPAYVTWHGNKGN